MPCKGLFYWNISLISWCSSKYNPSSQSQSFPLKHWEWQVSECHERQGGDVGWCQPIRGRHKKDSTNRRLGPSSHYCHACRVLKSPETVLRNSPQHSAASVASEATLPWPVTGKHWQCGNTEGSQPSVATQAHHWDNVMQKCTEELRFWGQNI